MRSVMPFPVWHDEIEKKLRAEEYDRVIALDELLYQMIPEDPYLKGEV